MIFVFVVLAIFVYLLIGGIIVAILEKVTNDTEDIAVGITICWPIALIIIVFCGIYLAAKFIGETIVGSLGRLFESIISEKS